MTRLEFIKELESLLPDIPSEEREEALRYYNGYFDDAGEENEDEIIKELGSPERVAKIIKAELVSNEEERENRGYFTERGYRDTVYDDEKLEIVKTANKDTKQEDNQNTQPNSQNGQAVSGQWNQNNMGNAGYAYNSTSAGNTANGNGAAYRGNAGYANGAAGGNYKNAQNTGNAFNGGNAHNAGNAYNGGTAYNAGQAGNSNNAGSYTNYNSSQGTNSAQGNGQYNGQGGYKNPQNSNKDNNTLLIVIALVTFPIWIPLVISALGVIIGILGAVVGLIFGLGAAGVSMICAGIALFVAGLVQISVPFIGLLLCGGGLIILGLGMLFTIACGALCTKALPAMIRGIVNLCRLPFKNRSVMA